MNEWMLSAADENFTYSIFCTDAETGETATALLLQGVRSIQKVK